MWNDLLKHESQQFRPSTTALSNMWWRHFSRRAFCSVGVVGVCAGLAPPGSAARRVPAVIPREVRSGWRDLKGKQSQKRQDIIRGNDGTLSIQSSLSAGYDFISDLLANLPLRAELLFISDTFGGGRGVDAVDVSSWQGELMALVGLDWIAMSWEDRGLRLQLLAGPGFRLSWVNIRVLDHNDSTWSAEAFGGCVAGVLYDIGPASVGLRVMWGMLHARVVHASGSWRF